MSKSILQVMPVLIANLGCEMIYVLCSRLKAQSVAEDKSIKVINDVVCSLFEQKFVSELFIGQEIAKHSSVKQLFEKLAHSSIMKLNANSMSKLFDLMLMSLKLQISRSRMPEEIVKITFNHLNSVNELLQKQDEEFNQDAIGLINDFIQRLKICFDSYSSWDFVMMRQSLMRFFQGKNIKVSIFIQETLQNDQGNFVLNNEQEFAPALVNQPGTLIDFRNKTIRESCLNIANSLNFIKSVHFLLRKNFIDLNLIHY